MLYFDQNGSGEEGKGRHFNVYLIDPKVLRVILMKILYDFFLSALIFLSAVHLGTQ